MKMTITWVSNGYVVKNGEETIVFSDALEEGDVERFGTNDLEKIALAKTLEYIADQYIPYDKFSGNNLSITWKRKGHKLND
ncbi:MAG: hypothetical protein KBD19_03140 [Candidatus Moranbacteria bacterium]|nr:hypothetical protein [Candidatus Moranbacteria bacterium]